ncbi:unnamed protein product [Ceutorhynchus assimilis]|uniref:Transmembrane protein 234 n=1 Tax=Ceutorhynchus assimilis TaxID=467358 RepID=A0A9N9MQI7_9CUCU|nr:unnamed protein product [Ceutorhynchus assimilis]
MFIEICSLICVSALWGLTNPIIKRNSKSITKIKADLWTKQLLLEMKYLITNFQYIIPMAINQLGSVLYFFTLQHVDLTLSVPLANSLTFIFTAIAGFYLEENLPSKRSLLGMILILFGTFLCCYDRHK